MQARTSVNNFPENSAEGDIAQIASALLKRQADRVIRAGGGGNSRIYRVEAAGVSYALKMYPLIQHDPRDRLGVEKKALQFFERHGLSQVPRWLADCPGYALLSWVEGELANPPTMRELERAVDFLTEIKWLSQMPDARELPPASEACTSGSEIIRQIERRLLRLKEAAPTEPALEKFLLHSFVPALGKVHNAALAGYAAQGLIFGEPLQGGQCLIPADFGFHNAIRSPNGELTFIDFEYFGWDDPVKLTADFLLHPAILLTPEQRKWFEERMCALFADDTFFATRLRALMPLFALRWTLILLNEFLPERWSGRAFAQGGDEWAAAKNRQLDKAYTMLHNAHEGSHA